VDQETKPLKSDNRAFYTFVEITAIEEDLALRLEKNPNY